MSSEAQPEIILYDLACQKGECFSPTVWRVRMMLNYKKVPYKTVFLEFPDIAPTLEGLGIKKPDEVPKYTVPAIHHIPTNTYMMDSMPILEFLIDKYPSPSITFSTDYTEEVRKHSLTTVGPIYRLSITSRELEILNPASQDYFRAGVEKAFNKPYEQLKEPEKEQAWWEGQQSDLAKVDQMVRANGGPFIMGKEPTASDFFMASSLRTMHEIYEPALDNLFKFKGFKELYEACQPWMERNN